MAKSKKPSVKVQDMASKENPGGGRKAGKGQQEYVTVKMEDVIVSSAAPSLGTNLKINALSKASKIK